MVRSATEGETATVTATGDADSATLERFAFAGGNRVLSFAASVSGSTGLGRIRAVDNNVDDVDVEKDTPDGCSVTGTVDDTAVTAPAPVRARRGETLVNRPGNPGWCTATAGRAHPRSRHRRARCHIGEGRGTNDQR